MNCGRVPLNAGVDADGVLVVDALRDVLKYFDDFALVVDAKGNSFEDGGEQGIAIGFRVAATGSEVLDGKGHKCGVAG